MKKIMIWPLIVVATMVLASCKRPPESSAWQQKLKEAAELGTVQYTVQKVVSNSDETWQLFGDRKILISFKAIIKAGLDMEKFNADIIELSDIETPATACFHRGNTQTWYQFFSNGSIHGLGTSVNNVREGRWVFYYPNGQMQTEATFVGGREEGAYNVYRDNGAPYYLGHYLNGERTGTWEVYDPEGNLVTTKQY